MKRSSAISAVLAVALCAGFASSAAAATSGTVAPYPGMVITADTTFTPGTYSFPAGQGITIAADDITVDGGGAVLTGPGVSGTPSSYAGTGITATGHSGVTVQNLTVNGFDTGLSVSNGTGWTITSLDLSGNYDDPSAQWVNGPSYGGLSLTNVSGSTVTGVTAHNDWDGLMLTGSSDNTITGNTISHCGDVCLWMWRSSGNLVQNDDFSYGVRCLTQDAACDSASALIQTHSDNNQFLGDNFTYGGDGVFIRTLNGVISTGNYFSGDDGSWAHNNAFESASPGNTFEHDTADHSSFGFWLGLSDHTVVEDCEMAYNGVENAHGPQPWGNGGVAVVVGGSSSFVFQGNNVHDNHNVGLGFGNQPGDEAWHWIVQQNTFANNATYGIYAYDARWVVFAGNQFSGNGSGDVHLGADVSGVTNLTAAAADQPPIASAAISQTEVQPGQAVTFDATASHDPAGLPLTYRWELGDGSTADTAVVSHAYMRPGFYRVGLDVTNGRLAALSWFDVYVGETAPETGTDGVPASAWQATVPAGSSATTSTDPTTRVAGTSSVRLDANASATLQYPAAGGAHWNLQSTSLLTLWAHYEHPDLAGFAGVNPVIRLLTDSADYLQLTPRTDLLDPWQAPYSEARYGWQRLVVPYAGDHDWAATTTGTFRPADVNAIQIIIDDGGGSYSLWLDDLTFQAAPATPAWQPNLAANPQRTGTPAPSASFTTPLSGSGAQATADALWAPVDGAVTQAWTDSGSGNTTDWYAVDLGAPRQVDEAVVDFVSQGSIKLPKSYALQYWTGSAWAAAPDATESLSGTTGTIHLAVPVQTSQVKITVANASPSNGGYAGIASLSIRDTLDVAGNAQGAQAGPGGPQPSASSNTGASLAPLDGSLSGYWAPDPAAGAQSWYAVDLGQPVLADRINLYLATGTGLAPPAQIEVQYFDGSQWTDVPDPQWQPAALQAGLNELSFDTVRTRAIRLLLTAAPGTVPAIAELEVSMANLIQLDPSITPSASYTSPYDTLWGPVDGTYGNTPRWTCWNSLNATDWYAVTFSRPTTLDRLNLFFYDDNGGVQPPVKYVVQWWDGKNWKGVKNAVDSPATPVAWLNTVTFTPVTAKGIRVVLTNQNPVSYGVYTGLVELEAFLL